MLSNLEEAERIYLFVQHLGRRLREIDAEHGLTAARYSTMASLRFDDATGDADDQKAINVGELAADERVKAPSMTRLLRDMQRDGLVRRGRDPDDGRGVLIALTPKGRAAFDSVRAIKIALVADYLTTLPKATREAAAIAFAALEELAESTTEAPAP
jgi:DNA-binding MarR family transcriptional regulator